MKISKLILAVIVFVAFCFPQFSKAQSSPTAVIQVNPISGPAPLRLTFDGSSSSSPNGSITAYAWDFGDGTTATGAIVSHFFRKNDAFNVVLIVTDNLNLTDQETVAITVTPSAPQAFIDASIRNGIVPLTVSFDGSSSVNYDSGNLTFSWTFGDGTTSTSPTVNHVFSNIGTFTVTLTVTDGLSMSDQDSLIINVLPALPSFSTYKDGLTALSLEWEKLNAAIIDMVKYGTNNYADTTIFPNEQNLKHYFAASDLSALYNARVAKISAKVDSMVPSTEQSANAKKTIASNVQGVSGFFSSLAGNVVNVLTFGIYSFIKDYAKTNNDWINDWDAMVRQSLNNPSAYPDANEALNEINITSLSDWDNLDENEKWLAITKLRGSFFLLDWQTESQQAMQHFVSNGAQLAKSGGQMSWNLSTAGAGIPDPKVEIAKQVTGLSKTAIEVTYATIQTGYQTFFQASNASKNRTIQKTTPDPNLPQVNQGNASQLLSNFIFSNNTVASNTLLQVVDLKTGELVDRFPFMGYKDASNNVILNVPTTTHIGEPIGANRYKSYGDLINLSISGLQAISIFEQVTNPTTNGTVALNPSTAIKSIDHSTGSTLPSNPYPLQPTYVNGTINVNTVWSPHGGVYVLNGSVTVANGVTLTIQPGVVVKFSSTTRMDIYGTLVADGTPAQKIVFTSLQDDSYGGDTNNDGSATTPAAGNWDGIIFRDSSDDAVCKLDNCVIRYGGIQVPSALLQANVRCERAAPTISNNEISYSAFHGIYLDGASPQISGNVIANNSGFNYSGILCSNGSTPVIDSNTFAGNHTGIRSVGSDPTIMNNTFTGNNTAASFTSDHNLTNRITGNAGSGNGTNGIRISGGLSGTLCAGNINFPYIIDAVTIHAGTTLTIEPDVIIKLAGNSRLTIQGALVADGTPTQKITFTSIFDDSYGGDTNNDGSGSNPAAGQWDGIQFTDTSDDNVCLLDNCVIKYGGDYPSSSYLGTMIDVVNASPRITNNEISYSERDGIRLNFSSPQISGNVIASNSSGIGCSNSNPSINNNSIFSNGSYGITNSTLIITINAKQNWWGDVTGPRDNSDDRATGGLYNPNGLGNLVSNYVDYDPWLTAPGTGTTVPDIAVNPTSHNYGNVGIGSSVSQTFVVSNQGTTDLQVTATTLAGADANQFSIASGGAPFTLAGGQSQNLVVSFNPTSAGAKNTNIQIASNDPNENPLAIALTGTGTAVPQISINDITVTEGNAGMANAVFTVTLSTPSTQQITVDYSTADGSATAGSDYVATPTTQLIIPANTTTQTITVQVNGDVLDETDETFFVNLSNPTNAVITDNQGQGTITDDDPLPALSINDISVAEGDIGTSNATITVSLSAASGKQVTVDYATADGTATAGSDYVSIPTTQLVFPIGTTTKSVTVTVNGDALNEPDETFFINLSNADNADISDGQGQGTIQNDDAIIIPTLSINDVSVTEGNSGTINAVFTVTLSAASSQQITVDYVTANGTATAGSDYVAIPTTQLIFPSNTTTQTITVIVNGDLFDESDETFLVTLTNPTNATFADAQGLGTISDDDSPAQTITLNPTDDAYVNANQPTSNFGTATTLRMKQSSPIVNSYLKFVVSGVSGPIQSAKIRMTVTVASSSGGSIYSVSNNYLSTSTPWIETGLNYNNAPAISGTPWDTEGTVTVGQVVEFDVTPAITGNGTFSFGLKNSSTTTVQYSSEEGATKPQLVIQTGATFPNLSINDVTVTEGNVGNVNATFTASLSAPSSQVVTVSYSTADGTASAGSDYVSASGIVSFPIGTTTQSVTISVIGDAVIESNETFSVNLSNSTNATIADAQGQGTITDDDAVTITLNSTDDAYVNANQPTTNFGTQTTLRMRLSSPIINSYLKFTVNGVSGTVLSAKLRMAVTVASSSGGSIYSVSNNYLGTSTPWIETGLTYNNAPTISGTPWDTEGSVTVGQVVELDVTPAITGNGTFSFGLKNSSTTTVQYSSEEGATKPQLIIQFAPGPPSLSINDITVLEGNSGTVNASFTVNLSAASSQIVSVNFATANGTATAGSDYVTASGNVTFPIGVTTQPITVAVMGDVLTESNETFQVNLTNPVNATLADAQGIGTITDDDAVTMTLNPTDDAFVRSDQTTTNFGTQTTLRMKQSSPILNSYLKFVVSGVTGTVLSAKLRMAVTVASSSGGSVYSVSNNLQGTSTPWTQSNLNYSNAPIISGTPLFIVGSVTVGQVVEFDVKAAITGNGIFSFGLNNASTTMVQYSSNEGATKPELVIQTGATSTAKILALGTDSFTLESAEATTPLPKEFTLSANYPNPFNAQTVIEYALPEAVQVRLVIFNVLGQRIRQLVDENQAAGYKRLIWNGRNEFGTEVGSGIYFLHLNVGPQRFTRKIFLQR